jgi:Ni/Fe-hydrogenase subunit HybB-like protein
MFSYLTTAAPQLGPLAWVFFIAQILGVAAGAYLFFLHTERNAARQAFMRQLAIALMILGGVGILLAALRMLNVPYINTPLWFWIQAVIELGVAGYIVYYVRSVLPALERDARARGAKASPRAARAFPNGDPTPATPRPVATTGRRDARRERKRKK